MAKINVEKYIKKYADRFFDGEVDHIRKRHEELYETIEFVHEAEMPNESTVIYKGKEAPYSAVLRMCPNPNTTFECVEDCARAANWTGNCRETCQ